MAVVILRVGTRFAIRICRVNSRLLLVSMRGSWPRSCSISTVVCSCVGLLWYRTNKVLKQWSAHWHLRQHASVSARGLPANISLLSVGLSNSIPSACVLASAVVTGSPHPEAHTHKHTQTHTNPHTNTDTLTHRDACVETRVTI